MKDLSTHIVKEADIRPSRRDGTCFYCRVPLGGKHEPKCVIRKRTVLLEVTFSVVIPVPEFWEPEFIEDYPGSSCIDNLIDDMSLVRDWCYCSCAETKFIREATKADEELYHITFDPGK